MFSCVSSLFFYIAEYHSVFLLHLSLFIHSSDKHLGFFSTFAILSKFLCTFVIDLFVDICFQFLGKFRGGVAES